MNAYGLSDEDERAVLRGEKVLVNLRSAPEEAELEFYHPLTQAERRVLEKLTDAWNAFVALPRCHPMEIQEGTTFVHGLQMLIMVRAAVRAFPEDFNYVEGFK